MTHNAQQIASLREARQTVELFEQTYKMTSEEMLIAPQGDPRLAQIDSFEMMDWHYALEQVKALFNVLPSVHGVASGHVHIRASCYSNSSHAQLENRLEHELDLVA